MLESLFGTSLPVFIGVTLVLFGSASLMMGRAIAENWQPPWLIWPYGLLLGATDRFLGWALFGDSLLSLPGFVLDSLVLVGIARLAYGMARAAKMVRQYPWLYERAGLLTFRERSSTGSSPTGATG